MKQKRFFILLILVLSLMFTASVYAQDADPISYEVIDDSEFTFTVQEDQPFTKIVSLAPSTTESIFWLEAQEALILRDDMSFYPEQALEIESVGSIWGGIPYELILEKEADLVIAPEIVTLEQVEEMRNLGLNVFYMKNPLSFTELFNDFYQLAILTGTTDIYDQKIIDLMDRYDSILNIIEQKETTPKVFIELDSTDPTKPYTVAAGSFIDYMIKTAGGENIASVIDNPWPQVDTEFLIEANPEVILMADYEWGVSIESLIKREGYEAIQAVENQNIFPIYSFETSVPGPRLLDGLENMAKMIHPELFPVAEVTE